MNIKSLAVLLTTLIGFTLMNQTVAASLSDNKQAPASSSSAKLHRVVFDVSVNEPESYKTLLRNIGNLRNAFGPENVQIKVVAYSKGLDLLLGKNPELAKEVNGLASEGNVELAACNNTVKARNLTASALPEKTTIVDSGVAELIRLQEEGWAYIKLASYQS